TCRVCLVFTTPAALCAAWPESITPACARFRWTKFSPPFRINSMQTPSPPRARIGLWITLAAGLLYCLWLGAHWLPLPYRDKELSASASRVWDIKTELTQHHQLPWWTPNFMSGSSYAINHTRGFYLIPWIAFSAFTGLETAGKLMALLAIFASGLAMYVCARHFLRHDWAAVLAGITYMLHREPFIGCAGSDYM